MSVKGEAFVAMGLPYVAFGSILCRLIEGILSVLGGIFVAIGRAFCR